SSAVPHASVVRTFSTVSRARYARRAPATADPRTRPAEGTSPAAAQLAARTRPGPGQGTPQCAGAPPTALGPDGPQRRRRTHRAPPGRRGQAPASHRRCPPRELARKPHPPGRPSVEPRKTTLKGALRASHTMTPGATLDAMKERGLRSWRMLAFVRTS